MPAHVVNALFQDVSSNYKATAVKGEKSDFFEQQTTHSHQQASGNAKQASNPASS
jgi:hypothetical protein